MKTTDRAIASVSSSLKVARIGAVVLLATASTVANADTIVGSKHDLSDPVGTNKVCLFCHTPHNANLDVTGAPLWNRIVIDKTFSMYDSPTMNNTPATEPAARSAVCLGCHDGNLAYGTYGGNTLGDKHDLVVGANGESPDISSYPNCFSCHPEMAGGDPAAWFGLDLTNDHPFSITYGGPGVDPELKAAPDALVGWGKDTALLFDGYVECATCHNVHDPALTFFLRSTNVNSALCLTCHDK